MQNGVSRNTVLAAFIQLHAEGYVEARQGSGTFVARSLPDLAQRPLPGVVVTSGDATLAQASARSALSRRGDALLGSRRMPLPPSPLHLPTATIFQVGQPGLDDFPHDLWARLYANRVRRGERSIMNYADPAGYGPLREQIAERIATTRGVTCDPKQVIIVSGSQQALEFSARLLLDPGDAAWIEDPGYLGTRAALASASARIVPIPVDARGFDVEKAIVREPNARIAYVTPSHQFPLGATMSLERRLALIEWAGRSQSWIVEDDYDNEFRYQGRPLAALHAIDPYGRVIYVGTFSKTMFPGLRLGYIVAPPEIVDGFVAAHLATDMHTHLLDQAVLADFMAQGHYARHLRKMRVLYRQRQQQLVTESARIGDVLRIQAPPHGLHVVGWLPDRLHDVTVAEHARRAAIPAWPLSLHTDENRQPPALLLGFAGNRAQDLGPAIRRLGHIIRMLDKSASTEIPED